MGTTDNEVEVIEDVSNQGVNILSVGQAPSSGRASDEEIVSEDWTCTKCSAEHTGHEAIFLSCKTCFAINPSFRNDHDIGDNPSSQEGAPPQSPCRVSCLVVCGIFLFLYEVVVCGIFLFLYEVIPFVNMFL